ncbi:MAG: hypothetical protein HY698_05975 [Deltaproteobacteria bacterium]|nr:hypothetical protein [Deltaproteobacteria bacterium]
MKNPRRALIPCLPLLLAACGLGDAEEAAQGIPPAIADGMEEAFKGIAELYRAQYCSFDVSGRYEGSPSGVIQITNQTSKNNLVVVLERPGHEPIAFGAAAESSAWALSLNEGVSTVVLAETSLSGTRTSLFLEIANGAGELMGLLESGPVGSEQPQQVELKFTRLASKINAAPIEGCGKKE